MNPPSVLVTGAGPTGLTAALALRAVGVPTTVLEAQAADAEPPGSRAIWVHKATLTHWEMVKPGLGYRIAADGLVWPINRTYWRGRQIHVRRFAPPPPNALPPFSSVPQARTEQHLRDACAESGINILWNSQVTDVESAPDSVEVRLSSGQTHRGNYLIAADGARSVVRRALGIAHQGKVSGHPYVVVDLAEDPADPMPLERNFHYQHPAVGYRNVLCVPFTGGWRLDLQCADNDDPDDLAFGDGLRQWLCSVLPERYGDQVTWVSTYRFLQLVAERFTDPHHRVLLAGDAAHPLPPFGARGMNSGVADAIAAATAVAENTTAAVEQFAQHRRSAALRNRDAAGKALRHIHASDPLTRLQRSTAALLARWLPTAGSWMDAAPFGPRTPASGTSKY